MKARKKLDRIFALLLVFTLIFNSQATALLAMEGEPVTEIAGSEVTPLSGTEGEQEIIDDNTVVIPDGEAAGDPAESVTQPEAAQGGDLVLDEESVPGSDSTSGQGDDSSTGQENAGENVAGTQELEPEPESKTEQPADAEPEIGQADPSISEPENEQTAPSGSEPEAGQETLSGSATEDGTGADEESGPAVDVESDSDIIVEEETEPQTLEQGADTLEPVEDEAETEAEYEAEVMAMGLDDEIMLTSLEGEDNEAKVIKTSGSETEYATFAEAVANAGNGDTVKVLKDTAEISTTITLSHSIIIELNGYTVSFSTDSKAGARIVVPNGYSLTVKGSGSMVGGVKSSATSNMERTIQVGSSGGPGGTLTVDAQADVEGIGNYGITTIQNDAQIHKIGQYAGTFTLDTNLNNSLDVVLEFEGTKCSYLSSDGGKKDTYTSTSYLTLGENFELKNEDIKINISTSIGGSTSIGKIHLESHWMKVDEEPVNPPNLTLIQGNNEEIVNTLINNIVVYKSRVKMQTIAHTEEGLKTVYWYRTVTPGVLGTSIVLWKHDEDDERFAAKHCVYVGGSKASDTNSGYTETSPVATIKKALELVDDTDEKRICLLDTLKISDTQTWDLPEGVTIERYNFTGLFSEIVEGGALTLNRIEIKGDGKPSDFALIKVNAGGKLNLNEGAVLKDNNHNYNTYYTCGGAIENKGGTVEINGGSIINCQAYNGGAISCDGGKLIMNGGELSGNNAVEAGGAVMLANGAEMELNGGKITDNTMTIRSNASQYDGRGFGGGIAVGGYRDVSINPAPKLTMNGGEIIRNIASECGGGIFVQANAEARIYKGLIDHNTAQSLKSGNYSGGGIYVNGSKTEILGKASNDGYLYLKDALITGNVARGDTGGGIAACPTASAKIYLSNGAAIYSNKYGNISSDRVPSDILIRRDSFQSYGTKIDVSEYMPNGQPYLWKEYNGGDDSGVGKLHRSDYINEYSLYTEQNYSGDVSCFSVCITNNDGYRAGGGIGTNGTVEIGTKPEVVSISAKKVWVDTGRESNRPKEKIKVWLLSKIEGGEFKRVGAEYLEPDKNGNWDSAMVTFPDQPKYAPGTSTPYEYTVEEDTEGIGPYVSTVTKGEGDVDWVITNTYTPTPTKATITGTKVLEGREWKDTDKFTFTLTETTKPGEKETAVPDVLKKSLTATATKTAKDFSFESITYTKPYVHTYQVVENDTSIIDITEDSTYYLVKVNVTDDGNGKLSAEVSYPQKEKDAEGKDTEIPAKKLTFTNTYTPVSTKATIAGTKVLTGREWKNTDEFTFELEETTKPKTGETAVPDKLTEKKSATATSAQKNFSFGPFTYTKPYVHTYTVRETSKSDKGITVDEKTYKVTVNVTDDGNGKLSAEVSYPQKEKDAEGKDTEIPAKKLTFTNTYTPAPTTATIAGTKVLTGREWKDTDKFTFTLTETTKPGEKETAVPDVLKKSLTATATENAKDFSFESITYTKPYVHTYQVVENDTSIIDITEDSTYYFVTVNVTDDGNGKLSAEVSYPQKEKDAEGKDTEIPAKKLTFTNTYTPVSTTATVDGTKVLTGREWTNTDEFTFELEETTKPKTGETAVPDKLTEKKPATATSAQKNFSFGPFTYTKPYVHMYEVKETSVSGKGIKVDEKKYTVTVNVTDDGSGKLSAVVSYPQTKKNAEGEDVAEDKVIFTNIYTAESCEATVSATKKLTGRTLGLQDKEFSFSLTPVSAVAADGKTEITDSNMDAETNPDGMLTVSNDGDGKVTFGSLTYTQAGTYTYELKEEATIEAGITKDPSVYTVTVSVTDDSLGNLHADVKYSKDGKEVAAADVVFENVYDAEDTSIRLGATKVFDRALEGGEFTFVLREVDQDGHAVEGGITREAANGKDGSVLFGAIPYDKEGTYYYQISETAGSDPTVLAYDAAVHTVTVTVKDVDAKLVATADLSPDKVTFTNTSTKAYLDKQDAETGAGIPGAVLRIVDKSNGVVVEEWTSDGKPHEVLGKLGKNGSYALEEVSAPDGYLPTGPIDFTMNDKGETVVDGQTTDTVVMKDTKNTISLLKLDESGQPLPGAHLVIEDATGTAVDNWVSDGTPHVARGLARGHYVMSEVEAPAGYHVSEDVPFEITGNETQPVEVQMTDTKIPERDNNKLTVMKHLQLDGITCDIGIHDAVFHVALFDDEAKTHRVSDVKALTFKDSAVSTAEFENLGKGTYYLGETDENGVLKESEIVNDRVIYYAQYGENAKVEFEGRKGEATSELTNVYVEVPEEGFYLSGRLTITKKVLLNGTEATSEDTFYARVFSDAALTSPNSDVVALAMNGGSTASVTVYNLPIGETLESSATYYVAETDKNGTPLDPDAVTEYRISIDKSEIVLNAENSNQEVTITNDFIEEEDETETETDLPDEPGAAPGSGMSAPKTGDETNLLLYLFYMMLSAGLFAAAAGEKRRRKGHTKK